MAANNINDEENPLFMVTSAAAPAPAPAYQQNVVEIVSLILDHEIGFCSFYFRFT